MVTTRQKIIFMGSPAFAVPTLNKLAETCDIVAVYSQPPRPAGRGQKEQPTAVHAQALKHGLTVFTPEKLRGEALDNLLATPCDLIVVVAYGLLLPKQLVESRLCLNLHPSALPRWRGAAPMQWALLAGDKTTDICIMQLEAGMDTGPIFKREAVTLPRTITSGELMDFCAHRGAELMAQVVPHAKQLPPTPQQGEATHARKLTSTDRQINWQQPAAHIHNQIRALSPAPGAFFNHQGEAIKVLASEETTSIDQPVNLPNKAPAGSVIIEHNALKVVCGDGHTLALTLLQRPGKKALPVADVLRGWNIANGHILGQTPHQH